MTDSEPSPDLVRFPWTQLAFSAACLVMAAWLWATYSWCVRVTPAELRAPGAAERLAGRYVEVTGHATYVYQLGGGVFRGILDPEVVLDPDCQWTDGLELAAWVRVPDEPPTPTKTVKPRPSVLLPSASSVTETHRGRVVLPDMFRLPLQRAPVPVVDVRAGPFGGEFLAGCAVAAMGFFIFALYLRGWLAAKRAQGIRCSA